MSLPAGVVAARLFEDLGGDGHCRVHRISDNADYGLGTSPAEKSEHLRSIIMRFSRLVSRIHREVSSIPSPSSADIL